MNKEPYDYTCHNCGKREIPKERSKRSQRILAFERLDLSSLQISKYNSNNQL